MRLDRDRVVLVAGAFSVALVLVGLAAVEANTGPFEHEVAPVEHATELDGSLLVEEGSTSTLCSSPAAEVCQPRTELELVLEGLPSLEAPAAYRVVLVDGDRRVTVGELEPDSGAHRLSVEAEIDTEAFEVLRVGLDRAGSSGALAFALLEVDVPDSGGERVPVTASADVRLASVAGQVDLAQIGAFEVAVTASARIEGLAAHEGWTYRAWLVDDAGPTWTPLGEVATVDETGRVDARVERVHLVDQDRFLVTLEPADGDGEPEGPAGFPVAGATVEASSLLDR